MLKFTKEGLWERDKRILIRLWCQFSFFTYLMNSTAGAKWGRHDLKLVDLLISHLPCFQSPKPTVMDGGILNPNIVPQGFNRFETLLSLALNFPRAHELALFAHHHAQSNSQSHCGKSSSIKTTYVHSICKQPCRCEDRTLTTISSSTRPHRAKPLYPSQPGLIGRSFCILLTQSSLSKAFVLSSTQVSLGRASPSSTRLYWVETLYAPQPGLIGQSLYILLNQALSGGASISSSTGPHRAKPLYSFRHGSGHFTFWAGTSAGSAKHAPPAPGGARWKAPWIIDPATHLGHHP